MAFSKFYDSGATESAPVTSPPARPSQPPPRVKGSQAGLQGQGSRGQGSGRLVPQRPAPPRPGPPHMGADLMAFSPEEEEEGRQITMLIMIVIITPVHSCYYYKL